MYFSIFSGSAILSIIMKCWDLENFQKHAKQSEITVLSHLFAFNIKKKALVDFLFLSLPSW